MTWQQKLLFIFTSAIFCLFLLRAAERPLRRNESGNPASAAPTALAMVATNQAPVNPASVSDFSTALNEFLTAGNQVSDHNNLSHNFSATPAIPEIIGQVAPRESVRQPLDKLAAPQKPSAAPQKPAKSETAANRQENVPYREEVALVTAYCPCARCCGARARGRTSLGANAWFPGIAADPRALAYGTKISVPGYGTYAIDDTGGAMRRHWDNQGILHVDIRMKWHHEAREWGKRWLKIRVYDP